MFNDENDNIINKDQPEKKTETDMSQQGVNNTAHTQENFEFSFSGENGLSDTEKKDEYDFEIEIEDDEFEGEDSSSDEKYTYSYCTDEKDYYDFEEQEKAEKKEKRIKKLAIAGVCGALVMCLAAGTLIGFTLSGKKNQRDTYFHHSSAAQKDSVTSGEQFVPDGEELTTEEVAAKVGPAVVGVINKTNSINFFNQPSESSGSGVIINEDGYIVTNFHVIENARELKVILNTGKECEASVIGYDSRSDLAVLKIEEGGLTYASFGDSSYVNVGGRVIAIGNPLGTELMGTVTQGIISAVNRTVTVDDKTLTLLQTDAAINSGNSGGPLVNAYGEVIGINSVKMSAMGVEGIGFAIPSNEVKTVVDDLIKNGYVTGRLMIGVSGTNITEKLSQYYDLPVGFYVNEVYEGYGAYLAGVQSGDVIIKCDGKKVETVDDINAIRDTHKVGDMMEVVVWRNGKEVTLKIRMMEENPEITQ
ncbi:MAG: trypsin-like peptidase domain-containing protein [Clostridia bacterium]|nr:trypsin-like peptidase domain-containing protein [Clostridia bacterium]